MWHSPHRCEPTKLTQAPVLNVNSTNLRHPDIFIPKIWILCNEIAHHLHTFRIVKDCERDSCLAKQMFGSKEIAVLADDD